MTVSSTLKEMYVLYIITIYSFFDFYKYRYLSVVTDKSYFCVQFYKFFNNTNMVHFMRATEYLVAVYKFEMFTPFRFFK